MSTSYVEITRSEHGHGGEGWEFGTCLWSPTANRSGADRYSLMREPVTGDRVFHFYRSTHQGRFDTWLIGESRVVAPARVVDSSPPTPGDWAEMNSYYRIDLEQFREFPSPVALPTLLNEYGAEIRDDLSTHAYKFYPFNTHGETMRTVQGIYLARCPQTLELIFLRTLQLQAATAEVGDTSLTHVEFVESRRLARERYFFARNAKLVLAAKRAHGYRCAVCGFDFALAYGDLGTDFIEAHHRNPLSERPEVEWSSELTTSIEGIAVVCANCHRMIHRRRPAITVEDLREVYAHNAGSVARHNSPITP
jgi:hypothetical protein